MTFVLGGTYAEAVRFSNDAGFERTCLLTSPNQLQRCTDVILVGTWYNRSDWDEWDRAMKTAKIKRRYPVNEEGF